MASTLIKVAGLIAAILLLPAVIAGGGFIIALVAALAAIVAIVGGREALDIFKKKRIAEKASRDGKGQNQNQDLNSLLGSIGTEDGAFSRGDKRE